LDVFQKFQWNWSGICPYNFFFCKFKTITDENRSIAQVDSANYLARLCYMMYFKQISLYCKPDH